MFERFAVLSAQLKTLSTAALSWLIATQTFVTVVVVTFGDEWPFVAEKGAIVLSALTAAIVAVRSHSPAPASTHGLLTLEQTIELGK